MNITNQIVPKKSLGGISSGERITEVIGRFESGYSIEKQKNHTVFNGGLITAYHDDQGLISSLSCNSKFKGNFLNKLWPGMTVADVMKSSLSQTAWSGFVQVDRIEGVGLSLPVFQDDFEKLSDEFDEDYIFEELWVYD
jgi:hypothetical protein